MRNLEQRIKDAEAAPAVLADRERRFGQRSKVGKHLAKWFAPILNNPSYVSEEEYEINDLIKRGDGWRSLERSIAIFSEGDPKYRPIRSGTGHSLVYETPSARVPELDEDIRNLVNKWNATSGESIIDMPDAYKVSLRSGLGANGNDVSMTIIDTGVKEEQIGSIVFHRPDYEVGGTKWLDDSGFDLDAIDLALLCAMPGAIVESVGAERALATALADQSTPLTPFVR